MFLIILWNLSSLLSDSNYIKNIDDVSTDPAKSDHALVIFLLGFPHLHCALRAYNIKIYLNIDETELAVEPN